MREKRSRKKGELKNKKTVVILLSGGAKEQMNYAVIESLKELCRVIHLGAVEKKREKKVTLFLYVLFWGEEGERERKREKKRLYQRVR